MNSEEQKFFPQSLDFDSRRVYCVNYIPHVKAIENQ